LETFLNAIIQNCIFLRFPLDIPLKMNNFARVFESIISNKQNKYG